MMIIPVLFFLAMSAFAENLIVETDKEEESQTLDKIEMVYVPGGSFNMGRTRGDGRDSELPVHKVTLSPFYIAKYELSQQEWVDVMGDNPSHFPNNMERPVEKVNWYQAIVYCNTRSIKENLTPVYEINSSANPDDWGDLPSSRYHYLPPRNIGDSPDSIVLPNSVWDAVVCDWEADGYRLPTEAEWEYAARSGSDDPDYLYAGGDNAGEVAWNSTNSWGMSRPVGRKYPNSLGIYDMSGNVMEWCWDWYDKDYYSISPVENPKGPSEGAFRICRGGSWGFYADRSKVSYRNYFVPRVKYSSNGLRLVRRAIE